MFDIGWTEIIVIIIIGCLVLDIKDVSKIIKWVREAIKHCNKLALELKQVFHDLEHETKKVIDLEGKEHIAYNLDDITPDLKKDTNEK